MRNGVDAQEANKRIELADAVLERSSGQSPSVNRRQAKRRGSRLTGSGLDEMSLVVEKLTKV